MISTHEKEYLCGYVEEKEVEEDDEMRKVLVEGKILNHEAELFFLLGLLLLLLFAAVAY
jgi:hypothetical protein